MAKGRLYPTNSEEAGAVWREFCASYGLDYTAVVEAISYEMARLVGTDETNLPAMWRQVIKEARAHQAQGRPRALPD